MITGIKTGFCEMKKAVLTKYFGRMNEMQKKAIFCVNGPVLILAGAGSGKTTVLVNRIANMVEFGTAYESTVVPANVTDEDLQHMQDYLDGVTPDIEPIRSLLAYNVVKPWNILAITFTNKAAEELKIRLKAMLGEAADDIHASTFHSACVRILRREIGVMGYNSSFTIYDTDDSIRVIKDILKSLNLDEKMFAPRSVLSAMGRAKDHLLTPAELLETAGEFKEQTIAKIYAAYTAQLKTANALDFDDIITLTVRLFQENPEILAHYQNRFKYVMVDEYQDTNNAQYKLVSLLSEKHNNLCVVGDDDQSIYKFRGATIENIMNFENQFSTPLVIKLEQNYRCSQVILDVANAVIDNNTQRKGKTLWTENGKGEPVRVLRACDELEESKFICDHVLENVAAGDKFGDHAILYRMNAQSNSVERAFVKSSIPYRIIGGVKFYERKEIKDVLAYLSLINNSKDNLRLKRIINEPKRGIGDATIATCQEIADTLGLSLFDVVAASEDYAPLSKKSKTLMEFAAVLKNIMEKIETAPLTELFDDVLEHTGYYRFLQTQGFEGQGRIENVNELKSNIVKYMEENQEPTLAGFLEEIALYTDMDTFDPTADRVVLMTIHSAKGLEFKSVFIVGMEEGIFPGIQSMYNPAEVEEERRLAYVGITRAKEHLYVTNAAQRLIFGQTARNKPSRFLSEIPADLCIIDDQTLNMKKVVPTGNKTAEKKPLGAQNNIGVSANMHNEKFSIRAGDGVKHRVFGVGMVLSVTPMGNDHLVEVAFDKVGTKKIMGNFAKLIKL